MFVNARADLSSADVGSAAVRALLLSHFRARQGRSRRSRQFVARHCSTAPGRRIARQKHGRGTPSRPLAGEDETEKSEIAASTTFPHSSARTSAKPLCLRYRCEKYPATMGTRLDRRSPAVVTRRSVLAFFLLSNFLAAHRTKPEARHDRHALRSAGRPFCGRDSIRRHHRLRRPLLCRRNRRSSNKRLPARRTSKRKIQIVQIDERPRHRSETRAGRNQTRQQRSFVYSQREPAAGRTLESEMEHQQGGWPAAAVRRRCRKQRSGLNPDGFGKTAGAHPRTIGSLLDPAFKSLLVREVGQCCQEVRGRV